MELRPSRVSRVGCAWIGACGLAVAQGTERVSVGANGDTANAPCELPSLSADGRLVAFSSGASNLVADDRTVFVDIFVRDRSAGTTELVSVDSAGVQGNGDSLGCGLSADGRFVAFESAASNLVADDTNGFPDVFVRDLQAGTTERVSVSSTGEQGDGYPGLGSRALSADGRWIVFSSYATHLVPGDSNGAWDVFVRDRATGTTERASLGPDGREGNGDSQDAAISTDGRFVAFSSGATNLVENDRNGVDDLFVFDRQNGATERVSVDSAGAEANGRSSNGSVSGDGRLVAFVSVATNLVAGDTNDVEEVFVHDRSTGATWRASVSSSGVQADGGGNGPELSADGRFVVFYSWASNLVAGDTNSTTDVFVHDLATAATRRVSVASDGSQGDEMSYWAEISADGRIVAFTSFADNLVPGDTGWDDVFVRDQGPFADWSNYGSGFAGTLGVPSLTTPRSPSLGVTATIELGNSSGGYSLGLLLVGMDAIDVPTGKGGHLLVVPAFSFLLGLTPWGPAPLVVEIPEDPELGGLHFFAQGVEIDAGAAQGLSFTPGIDLGVGI